MFGQKNAVKWLILGRLLKDKSFYPPYMASVLEWLPDVSLFDAIVGATSRSEYSTRDVKRAEALVPGLKLGRLLGGGCIAQAAPHYGRKQSGTCA
eukprot:780735-Amphidinium_carterae.1